MLLLDQILEFSAPSALDEDDRAPSLELSLRPEVGLQGLRGAAQHVASLAAGLADVTRCLVLVRDRANDCLVPVAGAGRASGPSGSSLDSLPPIPLAPEPSAHPLVALRTPSIVSNGSSATWLPEQWAQLRDAAAVLAAPLRGDDGLEGLLLVEIDTERDAGAVRTTWLLDGLTRAAAGILRSARVVDELKAAADQERRLSEAIRALVPEGSVEAVAGSIVEGFCRLLGTGHVALSYARGDAIVAPRTVARGAMRGTPGPALRELGAIVAARLPASRRGAVLIPSLAEDDAVRRVTPAGIRTCMWVSLRDGAALIGLVEIGRESGEFSASQIRLASLFATSAAAALARGATAERLTLQLTVRDAIARSRRSGSTMPRIGRILSVLNRQICARFGFECREVAFAHSDLAKALHARPLDEEERRLLRSARSSAAGAAVRRGRDLGVPISLDGRTTGLLWIRAKGDHTTALDAAGIVAEELRDVVQEARQARARDRHRDALAAAAERDRIAADLHDTIGQTLFGLRLKLKDLLADVKDPSVASRLTQLHALSNQALDEVRSAVYALSFMHVKARGLLPSLRTLVRQFERGTRIRGQLRVVGGVPVVSREIADALYRVAHEALVNVERHSGATTVRVTLEVRQGEIAMTVEDDGAGLGDGAAVARGSQAHFGMRSMSKTIEGVGGLLTIVPGSARGLIVRATVPLRQGSR